MDRNGILIYGLACDGGCKGMAPMLGLNSVYGICTAVFVAVLWRINVRHSCRRHHNKHDYSNEEHKNEVT